jgi:hypothetical protein
MSIRIVNKPLLLDEISSFDTYACLFTNSIELNEDNPSFSEPSFNGYSPFLLDSGSWGTSIQEEDYSTKTYNQEVFWTNNGAEPIVVEGHFVKNLNEEVLWFDKFESPVTIGNDEKINVYPKLYLNKYNDLFNTFFIFKIINPYPSPIELTPTVTITDELWGSTSYSKSLISFTTGDSTYGIINNSLNLALDPQIQQTNELPFSFKIKLQQSGFYITEKVISISETGVYDINLYMIEVS